MFSIPLNSQIIYQVQQEFKHIRIYVKYYIKHCVIFENLSSITSEMIANSKSAEFSSFYTPKDTHELKSTHKLARSTSRTSLLQQSLLRKSTSLALKTNDTCKTVDHRNRTVSWSFPSHRIDWEVITDETLQSHEPILNL